MKATSFAAVLLAALIGGLTPAPAADVPSIYDYLAGRKEYSILFLAVGESKDAAGLKAPGQMTLFAPPDAAFLALDDQTVKAIATDKDAAQKLVQGHLVAEKLTAAKELKELHGKDVRTLLGTTLKVESLKDGFRVGGARLKTTDVTCSNGVIHVIDAVLPLKKE